jgi:hypothetical protein
MCPRKLAAEVCPAAVSVSISYPYAYAEALTPQEREPEGRARAELAEVWGWLQRIGLMAAVPYDSATRVRKWERRQPEDRWPGGWPICWMTLGVVESHEMRGRGDRVRWTAAAVAR